MQENHDRNKQLREENYELANKLKKFIEQYEAREKVGIIGVFFTSTLPEIANFSTEYFILSKVYTDEGGVK